MRFKRLTKYTHFFPYLLILWAANFLANLIIHPRKKSIALIIMGMGAAFFLLVRQQYVFITVLFLAYFPKYLRGLDSTIVLVILLAGSLFIRSTAGQQSAVSFKRITDNPFFLPSLCIWFSYLIAWFLAISDHPFDLRYQTFFLIGISCALLLANMIIGFVHDQQSLRTVQLVFLLLLFLNLLFGTVFYFIPGLVIVPGLIEDLTVYTGAGTDMRLGGLTFAWEAYAEYLMMATVILLGLIINRIYKQKKFIELSLILLLLLTIIQLLLTNTRGAIIIAVLGSILVILYFSKMSFRQKSVTIFLFFLMTGTALLVAQQSGHLTFFERMETVERSTRTEYGYIPTGRAEAWLPILNYLKEHGLGGYGPTMLSILETRHIMWPHNSILLLLMTVGIFGLCAFTFLFIRLILLIKRICMLADPEQRLFFQLLWLAFLLFWVDTLKFDGFLRELDGYSYHVWISLGLIFSSYNLFPNYNHG